MIHKFILLRDEIEEQLVSIRHLEETMLEIKKDDLSREIFKRVYASILEDFYMAIEKIFKAIASDIDNNIPDGNRWHKKLLRQMSIKIPEIRPAVIDKNLFHNLEEYLKFRHLIHNIYGFQLKYDRFDHLIEKMPEIIDQLEKQLNNFLSVLEQVIIEDDE